MSFAISGCIEQTWVKALRVAAWVVERRSNIHIGNFCSTNPNHWNPSKDTWCTLWHHCHSMCLWSLIGSWNQPRTGWTVLHPLLHFWMSGTFGSTHWWRRCPCQSLSIAVWHRWNHSRNSTALAKRYLSESIHNRHDSQSWWKGSLSCQCKGTFCITVSLIILSRILRWVIISKIWTILAVQWHIAMSCW